MNTPTPPTQITEPETFIIESLTLEDESENRCDGRLLYDALKLQKKKPVYYYFRTIKELEFLATEFRKSGYRYLHLSCHGGENKIATTFESINYKAFAMTFKGKLNNRRVFVAGCGLGDRAFAEALFEQNGGMYSLTAPKQKVWFDQSMVFWSAFYYLMHSNDSSSMKKAPLVETLNKICPLLEVPIGHFFKNAKKKSIIDEETYGEQNKTLTGCSTLKGSGHDILFRP